MGGIGNQMFAYAAAKSLSIRNGIPFKLDFDCPYKYVKYEYALDVFKLQAQFPTRRELRRIKPKKGIERRIYSFLGKNTLMNLIKEEKEFTFSENFYNTPTNSYISGFWQSEKYFLPIADEIRQDFCFKNEPSTENLNSLSKIRSTNSISVHVRRGDYVNFAKTNLLHGTCSIDYYRNAIALIEKTIQNPVYFFFSNDIGWVKKNIPIQGEHYFIENNSGPSSFEDLRLMSNCRHNIIANSSFSWWGAWLNNNDQKIVITPKKWMNNSSIPTPDLIPVSWIRID